MCRAEKSALLLKILCAAPLQTAEWKYFPGRLKFRTRRSKEEELSLCMVRSSAERVAFASAALSADQPELWPLSQLRNK